MLDLIMRNLTSEIELISQMTMKVVLAALQDYS